MIGEEATNTQYFIPFYGFFSVSTSPLFKLRLVTSRPDYLFLSGNVLDEREDPQLRPPPFFLILPAGENGGTRWRRKEGRGGWVLAD